MFCKGPKQLHIKPKQRKKAQRKGTKKEKNNNYEGSGRKKRKATQKHAATSRTASPQSPLHRHLRDRTRQAGPSLKTS